MSKDHALAYLYGTDTSGLLADNRGDDACCGIVVLDMTEEQWQAARLRASLVIAKHASDKAVAQVLGVFGVQVTIEEREEKSMNTVLKDGAIMVTVSEGSETALVTIRGKDHDLTASELHEFAAALSKAAGILDGRREKTR